MSWERRDVLGAMVAFGGGGLAGCGSPGIQNPGAESTPSATTERDATPPNRDWTWEFTEDCSDSDGIPGTTYTIQIEYAVVDRPGTGTVVRFSDLSQLEKDLLGTVIEEGGYGACDSAKPDGFSQFVGRISDCSRPYLKRDEIYYKLYIIAQDAVCG